MQFKSSGIETQWILVSFHAKWLEAFRSNPPEVVFRHRVPSRAPEHMYIYIGSPVKALIGTCEIVSVNNVSGSEAMALCAAARIEKQELEEYIAERDSVSLYRLCNAQVFNKPITLDTLRSCGRFYPPQSFFFLSQEGVAEVDRLVTG